MFRGFVLALYSVILVNHVYAAEWTRGASLSVSGIYTDNAALSEENQFANEDPESDTFAVATPALQISGTGSRATVSLSTALQFNTLSGEGDNFNPNVSGNAHVEVIDNFFFIDTDVGVRQTQIDPFRRAGANPLNRTGNSTTTSTYSITPSVQHRFGSFADFRASYRSDDLSNNDNRVEDSSRQDFNATLSSGPQFDRLSWSLSGDIHKTDYDNNESANQTGNDNEGSSASLGLGYRLDRKWQLNGSIGNEWNDYATARNRGDQDGATWSVGANWTPTTRTNFSFGYQDSPRTHGPQLDFSHRSRRTEFSASFDRKLRDQRDIRATPDSIFGTDPSGDSLDPFPGQFPPIFDDLTFTDPGVFIDERFEVSFSIQGRRTRVGIQGRRSEQTREDNNDRGIFESVSINASRTLSRYSSLNSSLTLDSDEDEQGLTSDSVRFNLGYSRQIGVNTSLSINYSYSTRDSERSDDDYDENRVAVTLSRPLF